MDFVVIREWNSRAVVERDAVELEHGHSPANAARILHGDVVPCRAIPKRHREPWPSRWDAPAAVTITA